MKRLILGLAAFSFLAFVGAQALHRHEKIAQDSCDLCHLGGKTIRHAPAASPAIVVISTWENISLKNAVLPDLTREGETASRAPPLS